MDSNRRISDLKSYSCTMKDALLNKGVDHLHYMAPLATMPLIAAQGILSYNCRLRIAQSPQMQELLEALGSRSIADPLVQMRRHCRTVDGVSVHDMVPLYFAVHTPMQYVVTRDSSTTIAFAEVDVEKVFSINGTLFTNGNAAADDTSFYNTVEGLREIDWSIVFKRRGSSKKYKRLKCAEVLVPDMIPQDAITRYVFMTNVAERKFWQLIETVRNVCPIGGDIETKVDESHFF